MTVTSAQGGSFKVTSMCPKFTGISHGSALKGSNTTPCTNVPVICELCIQLTNSKLILAVWRYNLHEHIKTTHPGHTQLLQLSPRFREFVNISANEKITMGIPKEQIPAAFSHISAINLSNLPHGIKHRADNNQSSHHRTKLIRSS